MYDLEDEDIDNVVHLSQSSAQSQSTPLETQVPVLELLKVRILGSCFIF